MKRAEIQTARSVRHVTLLTLGALAGAVLAGCGGGGNVNIGKGQTTDPATVDFPIFYVKRSVPMQTDDLRELRDFQIKADLFERDKASPSGIETNITARITKTDNYDIKDVDASADGKKVVFAMRGPLDPNMDEDKPPTWAIWEYVIATDTLHRVIPDDTTANAGNDIAPHYLADGRIVFSSTRQRASKAVLLDENKPQFEARDEQGDEPSFVLHVMNADGSAIHQVSFNQSHDRDVTLRSDGRLMWTRWDHAPGKDGMHLYTSNPDGTDLQLLYGANSHDSGSGNSVVQFVKPREMADGRVLTLIRPYTDTDFGGDLVIIDTKNYVENTQPVLTNAGGKGPAQVRATQNDVRTVPGPSPGGRFNSAFPLWDGTNRTLVSWEECRLLDTTVTPNVIVPCTDARLSAPGPQLAPALYSVWMFDPAKNTLLPIMTPTEGVMITDVVAVQPRALPTVILDKQAGVDLDPDLTSQGVGVIDIRSIYDFDGTDAAQPNIATVSDPAQTPAPQRAVRFIRLEKAVSIPADRDVLDLNAAAFGATPYMREILGYAPVEPDGSVKIEVPANVAFQISLLDSDGRRVLPVHSSWLQLKAGEQLTCIGCHTPATSQNPLSHGRSGLFHSVYAGAAAGQPFPNTNPVFSPESGDTMAQVRMRASCANDAPRCFAERPSVDVLFTDVWTNPAQRTPDPGIAYRYADLLTPAPTSDSCKATWSAICRIVINYEQHIHPLWKLPRVSLAADGVTVLSDHTCTSCHAPKDANNQPQVPAGQLDLSDGPSNEVPQQFKAYRELLFTDNEQEVNMGALQDRLVPGPIDPATGQPTQQTATVQAPMIAGNARASGLFFDRFNAGGTHAGYLSPAELRLLSEWLDIGAQYFNNPFDPAAPVN